MNRSTRIYNKNTNPFFSFTGKKFSQEKTYVEHYSYDVHGNVKTLIQDNAGVSIPEQRYKRMDYEYDLISGKVNAVHYQNNHPDQFHHKYEYDADNRLTDVYTSSTPLLGGVGGGFWDHDAKYFYYPHGPLARVEYGDNHVQGIDYAYTLQGWIKGINSETLSETNDLGHDGNPLTGNPNAHFAKDAFGYSLTYFEGDYKSIGTSGFEANKQNSDLLKARNDLFNGNISAMVTTIVPPTVNGNTISYSPLPQGTAYKYDQLNRLIEMKAWQNMDAENNIWGSGLAYAGMYHNQFTYDGNGNIETAFVKNNLGEIIDDQTYHYNLVSGKKTNNRLLAVADVATQTDGYDLPSTQQANNYIYTELGELKQDVQDSILDIIRRTDGKILQVIRTAGSTKKNLKFDYDATGNRIAKHVYNNDGTWIKSEFYVRDAQGNILSTYKHAVDASTQTAGYKQTERHLYGSSLLGIDQTQTELIGAPPVSLTTFSRTLGLKSYTGANHLGNDLVIFTDKKIGIDKDNDGIVNYYIPDVISSKDYGPFGEYLTGRVFNANQYPNSFNGKRDDEELFGWQDYGFRNYMKAVRRFDRVDPIASKYPYYTPYSFAGNKPIWAIDIDGLEDVTHTYLQNQQTGKKVKLRTINYEETGELGHGTLIKTHIIGEVSKVKYEFTTPEGAKRTTEEYSSLLFSVSSKMDNELAAIKGNNNDLDGLESNKQAAKNVGLGLISIGLSIPTGGNALTLLQGVDLFFGVNSVLSSAFGGRNQNLNIGRSFTGLLYGNIGRKTFDFTEGITGIINAKQSAVKSIGALKQGLITSSAKEGLSATLSIQSAYSAFNRFFTSEISADKKFSFKVETRDSYIKPQN